MAPQNELSAFFAVPGLRTLPSAPRGATDEEWGTVTYTGGSSNFDFSPSPMARISMERWDPPVYGTRRGITPSMRTIPGAGPPIRIEPSMSSRPAEVPWLTRENIRAWAEGRLCSIPIGREREVIESLARIVVREEVLP